jgi:DNA-binding transcriptional LysR family regulator
MKRPLKLRQIEAFRALIDAGTVTRAAEQLQVSQPAVSKLLANLEADCAVSLFERVQGRLIATAAGIRLYEEIERIFAGVHQVEQAVEAIRREEQGQLIVGVTPALSEALMPRILIGLLRQRPQIYVSVRTRSSQLAAEWLKNRQVDVGLVTTLVDNPYLHIRTVLRRPLVCVLPVGHRLAEKAVITPQDLDGEPFISSSPGGFTSRAISGAFDAHHVKLNIVLDTATISGVSDFVAAGIGVSLLHPLFALPRFGRVVVRPFEPVTPTEFQICWSRQTRNQDLVDAFVAEVQTVSEAVFRERQAKVQQLADPPGA